MRKRRNKLHIVRILGKPPNMLTYFAVAPFSQKGFAFSGTLTAEAVASNGGISGGGRRGYFSSKTS